MTYRLDAQYSAVVASDKLDQSLHQGDTDAVLELWSSGGTTSGRLARALAREGALRWADSLAASGPRGARLAAAVLAQADASPEHISARLRELAVHSAYRVRDGAAQALGQQLLDRFADFLPIVESWASAPEVSVRRAAVQATAVPAATGNIGWSDPLLEALAPLLADRTPQVSRALGPGVLAEVYLEALPDDTVEHLAHWSTSHDEQVLWNVALAFSGSAGGKVAAKALIVLRRLALDERPYVRAAVSAALGGLVMHAPHVSVPKLQRWLAEEERAPLARAALRSKR